MRRTTGSTKGPATRRRVLVTVAALLNAVLLLAAWRFLPSQPSLSSSAGPSPHHSTSSSGHRNGPLKGSPGGGGSKVTGGGGSITIDGQSIGNYGTGDASSGSFDVKLDDNYFRPTVIDAKPGQKVTLELENEGGALHNFQLDSQSIDTDVASGHKQEVTVTIPKSGTLKFVCKYHASLGMVGELKAK